MNDSIEQEIQAKANKAPRVTLEKFGEWCRSKVTVMSPRNKRRMLDMIFTVFVAFVLSLAAWWAPFIMLPWGLWNFYDGMTHFSLKK